MMDCLCFPLKLSGWWSSKTLISIFFTCKWNKVVCNKCMKFWFIFSYWSWPVLKLFTYQTNYFINTNFSVPKNFCCNWSCLTFHLSNILSHKVNDLSFFFCPQLWVTIFIQYYCRLLWWEWWIWWNHSLSQHMCHGWEHREHVWQLQFKSKRSGCFFWKGNRKWSEVRGISS